MTWRGPPLGVPVGRTDGDETRSQARTAGPDQSRCPRQHSVKRMNGASPFLFARSPSRQAGRGGFRCPRSLRATPLPVSASRRRHSRCDRCPTVRSSRPLPKRSVDRRLQLGPRVTGYGSPAVSPVSWTLPARRSFSGDLTASSARFPAGAPQARSSLANGHTCSTGVASRAI